VAPALVEWQALVCYDGTMAAGGQTAAEFYATARGVIASRLVRDRLVRAWPHARGMGVLGLGFAAPYLQAWQDSAAWCIAASPVSMDVARWPAAHPNLACAVEEDSLPFPDLSCDRILLVHGLEVAENARRMLREVWRVLKDDGRLLVVAPNRMGLWAHLESTPFGDGQPYSPGQIGRLLAASLFRVEARDSALYVPPARLGVLLRSAAVWERGGRYLAPRFAGVTITEAVKDVYAGLPVQRAARRRLVLSNAA